MSNSPEKTRNASQPLFSICLPSRDRIETVTQSIKSVLSQSYQRFELLVSDNSIEQKGQIAKWVEETPEAIGRVRVFETPHDLDMDENWEFISTKATGDYVMFLADRWLMRPGTLDALSRIVAESNPDLFYWPGQKFGELERKLANDGQPLPLECEIEHASAVMERFLQFEGYQNKSVYGQPIPRALNSGFRRGLGIEARKIWGSIFRPISPDYTSATALLLLADKCVHIKEMMYTPVGDKSNFSNSTILGLRAYLDKHPDCNEWRGLRFDAVFLTVLKDIENTLDVWPDGERYKKLINLENALKCIIWELHFKEFNGSVHDTMQMRRKIYDFARSNGVTEDGIKRIRDYDRENRHRHVGARRLLRQLGLYEQVRSLNDKLRHRKGSRNATTESANANLASRAIQFLPPARPLSPS